MKEKRALALGSLIGALLGAGAAWLMVNIPSDLPEDEESKPISASEIISLTGAAAALLRMANDFRQRL